MPSYTMTMRVHRLGGLTELTEGKYLGSASTSVVLTPEAPTDYHTSHSLENCQGEQTLQWIADGKAKKYRRMASMNHHSFARGTYILSPFIYPIY